MNTIAILLIQNFDGWDMQNIRDCVCSFPFNVPMFCLCDLILLHSDIVGFLWWFLIHPFALFDGNVFLIVEEKMLYTLAYKF